MAVATTLETLSPKELGKHLRDVRRRKGLSLSEVARGAGLTRRELNAYEKGRIPIPDSDLFVLAGSCGVDVAELRVPTTAAELSAAQEVGNALVPATGPQLISSTIEDAVAQLRRSHDVAAPSVPAVSRRRRPRALGAADEPAPEAAQPTQSEWPIERIDPFDAVQWPGDESIASPSATTPHAPAEPIDVFEELARLPEPVPFPSNDRDAEDMFGPRPDLTPPPTGAVEDVDSQTFDEWPAFESDYEQNALDESDAEPVLVEMAQSAVADLTSAADAPPIDVAMRGESFNSPWDSLRSSEALSTPVESESAFGSGSDWSYESPAEVTTEPVPDTYAWRPVAPTSNGDAQWFDESSAVATPDTDPEAFEVHEDDEWTAPATADAVEVVDAVGEVEQVDAVTDISVSQIFDPRFTGLPAESAPGSWAHEPDPEATSTGFYIDWGEPEDDGAASIGSGASAWDLPAAIPETVDETEHEFEFEAQPKAAAETIAVPWGLATELQAFATAGAKATSARSGKQKRSKPFEPIDAEPLTGELVEDALVERTNRSFRAGRERALRGRRRRAADHQLASAVVRRARATDRSVHARGRRCARR